MDSLLSSLKNVKSAFSNQQAANRLHGTAAGAKSSLTNKKECVQCILGFLASRDFHPCSAKDLLKSPPLQILLDIWNFLFRLVDEAALITKENMAIEVPKFFKEFGYPHIMKTSHLRTPTADHQWESNLVALSWLCKLLLYEQECFHREFEGVQNHVPGATIGLEIGARGKATISDSRVAQFVTEQATKHYHLYLQGEENSIQLMADFEATMEEQLTALQESVDSKTELLDGLRDKTLELQEELETFTKSKDWVKTANGELKRIEEVTATMRGGCMQAEDTLKKLRQTLKEEEEAMAEQERQNKELEEIVEKQDINKDVLIQVTQVIRAFKTRIADHNRRIKEIEHEIPTTETNATAIEAQLGALEKAIANAQETIVNFLANNGRDAAAWKGLDAVHVNPEGQHETEILGICPSAYSKVLQEIINKDTELMQLSNEAREELEEANQQLEQLGNAITKETSDTLREASTLFKANVMEERESNMLDEANTLADTIRDAAKDDLARTKREMEAVEQAVIDGHNSLRQQELRAQNAWKDVVERYKEMFKMTREIKEANCQTLRKLIELERSLFRS